MQVRQCIQNNQPHKLPLQYQPLAQEMSIVDNIVLRDNRIILPTKLRSQAIKLAHEDHAGMTKTKQRIRSKLWWPNMDKDIEQHIRTCHPCQIVGKPDRPEPVQPTKLPDEPWTELANDDSEMRKSSAIFRRFYKARRRRQEDVKWHQMACICAKYF